MSAPNQRSETVADIVVEVESSPGSGVYTVDERLRADRIDQHSDERIAEASIAVRLDDQFDATTARQRYLPDLRLVIRTDEVDPAKRVILFDGYPARQESVREGRPGGGREDHRIDALGVYGRLAQDRRAWIYGRRMRNAAILDEIDGGLEEDAARSVHVQALPCVFNLDGVGNRAAHGMAVTDATGAARRIFLFSHDGDPDAVKWSLLDAVRYLAWFHRLPEGAVSLQNLLDATESSAGLDPEHRRGVPAPSMAVERLLSPADDLNCEAANLVEALALAADRAGLHVTCVAENHDGRSQSSLRLWAAEDGVAKEIPLAWGGRYRDGTRRYDAAVLPPRDIFSDNHLQRIDLAWDDASIVNAPLVVGGVKQWEMRVDLLPGWEPEEALDDVALPDRPAAKGQALTPDIVDFLGNDAESVSWYRKYHRRGSEFAEHRNVARLWVLNEDGAFERSVFGRYAPFDEYGPFEFSTVADERATSPGQWTRRPRPMQAMISGDGAAPGVLVEVSYDAGVTWHEPVGSVTVLKDRAGIWFGLANPTAMIPPGEDWYVTNLWYALIDQVFRVRVTGVFDGDERLVARGLCDPSRTPTLWNNARLVYEPGAFRFAGRQNTAAASSSGGIGGASGEVDHTAAAESLAGHICDTEGGGKIVASPTIPWLDDRYSIGDRIQGLRGRDLPFNGVLRSASVRGADWAVVGKTYLLSEGKLESTLHLARRAPTL